ncbi:hypothetical protein ACIQ62_32825 [Streptomyces sp. NPDC096319]
MKKHKDNTMRRLGRTAMFSLVRGTTSAAGGALLGWITWWLQSH